MTDEDVRNEAEELVHDTFPSMDTVMARRYIEQAERRLRTLLARDRREMAGELTESDQPNALGIAAWLLSKAGERVNNGRLSGRGLLGR